MPHAMYFSRAADEFTAIKVRQLAIKAFTEVQRLAKQKFPKADFWGDVFVVAAGNIAWQGLTEIK